MEGLSVIPRRSIDTARLLKTSFDLVQQWRSLPREQRESIREQGQEVIQAGSALKSSLGSWLRDAAKRRRLKGYQQMLDSALNPPPDFALAKRIVAILREEGPLARRDLAERVGVPPDDDLLEEVLTKATGFHIKRLTGNEFRLEAVDEAYLLDSHLGLSGKQVTSEAVEQEARRISEILHKHGLRKSPQLWSGGPFLAQAGLERLERQGEADWHGWVIHGLPIEELSSAPTMGLDEKDLEARPEVRSATQRLSRAVDGLSKALQGTTASGRSAELGVPFADEAIGDVASEGVHGVSRPETPAVAANTKQSLAPMSANAMDAFAAAWLSVLGPDASATREQIVDFVLSQWQFLDPKTRQWLPEMHNIWAKIQTTWPTMSDADRERLVAKWRPVFLGFENRFREIAGASRLSSKPT